MADYIINYTDSSKVPFTIKPYTTNGPAIPTNTALAPNATSANTSLVLLGQGMYQYGEIIAEDFVHLLENFASPNPPVYPIQGQLWYNNVTKELFVYDGTTFAGPLVQGTSTGNLNLNNFRIINLANPINPQDAVNLQYADGRYVALTGSTLNLNANVTFNGGEVLGLPATPSGNTAATSKLYVDTSISNLVTSSNAAYVFKTGDTLTGSLTFTNNAHIYLPTPSGGFTLASDVINKAYVDAAVSGGSTFVHITGDTMTGPLVISGNTLYNGPTLNILSHTISTIEVDGGNSTSAFINGVQFTATLDTVPYTFTTLNSTYNVGPNSTTITITGTTPTFTSGTVSTLYGLSLTSNAKFAFDGGLAATGISTLDFGHNLLQFVATPISSTDAATKGYVDTAIAGINPTSINSVTYASNTLTIVTPTATFVTTGIADQVHTHIDSDITYNGNSLNSINSVLRDNLMSSVSYPAVTLTDAISILDNKLYDQAIGNDRHVFNVQTIPITAISAALTSNLTITAVTTGLSGSYTVSGGDFTTTFIPDAIFTVSGNTGVPAITKQRVASSSFSAIPNTTTIVVNGTVNPATTADGVILQTYGAIECTGNLLTDYTTNSKIAISGNSGTGNGNYQLTTSYLNAAATSTFLEFTLSTPLPVGTTATGTILPLNIILPFNYVVGENSLQLFRMGVKQYESVRAYTKITIPVVGNQIALDRPTNLAAGAYSLNMTVDGGVTQVITINPSYTLYTITAVDTVNNSWTITGAPANYVTQFQSFEVVGNVGLGVTTLYTVKSVQVSGVLTTIFTNEVISGTADVSGSTRRPYTFRQMVDDLNTQISLATWVALAPILTVRNGYIYVYSPTVGATSSVVIADVSLLSAFVGSSLTNIVGADYAYTEFGSYSGLSNRLEFVGVFPAANDVYEIINIR